MDLAGTDASPERGAISVALSTLTVDAAVGGLRKPPHPPEERSLDYIERFDFFTLFYDVFRSVDGERIIAIGPPLSAEAAAGLRAFTWPDRRPCRCRIVTPGAHPLEFCTAVTITPPDPAACDALLLEAAGRRWVVPVQPNLGPFFAGSRVLLVKNRNNDLLWIRDWAEFHAREFGFDAVLFYDTRSDRYTLGEIERVLLATPGIRQAAVIDVAAPFGPIGSATAVRVVESSYLQYAIPFHGIWRMAPLADLVFHVDIDELLVVADPDAFAALLSDPEGSVVMIGGENVLFPSAPPGARPRHRDSAMQVPKPVRRPAKWIARPRHLPLDALPHLHAIGQAPMTRCPPEVATIYNFLSISTGWNAPKRLSPQKRDRLVENASLRRALDRQPWALETAIGAWDPVAEAEAEDASLLARWGAERLQGGDRAARAGERALALDPALTAARELRSLVGPASNMPALAGPLPDLPAISQMSAAETALFDAAASAASCVIEFGSGDSTRRLVAMSDARMVSVDSVLQWTERVAAYPAVAAAIAAGWVEMLHVDIGPTKEWGYPENEVRREHWPEYWRAPWREIDPGSVDLVIVDGRFRVACALHALLTGVDGLVVLIHDYDLRRHYFAVERHAECIGRAGTSRLFVRGPGFDRTAAERDLAAFAYDPR